MMISMMERVCMDLVQPLLPSGRTTVGFEVHVRHKAPASLGASLVVGCKLLEVNGRKLLFEVQVTEGDRLIGAGTHRRTIISVSG
jgi:fluoroacetyl-CoA thioesterase